jgi:hypothetical protein
MMMMTWCSALHDDVATDDSSLCSTARQVAEALGIIAVLGNSLAVGFGICLVFGMMRLFF